MAGRAGAGRQGSLEGVIAPLNIAQEAALRYLEAKKDAAEAAETAKDRKDDLIAAAQKIKQDVVKVRDDANNLIIFDFTNDVKMKQSTMTDRKIEKAETASLKA